MATLIVQRDQGYADSARKYRILLDGAEIGKLAQGMELRHDISSGPHTVEARIDWCGSRPCAFMVESDECVLVVRSALRGINLIFAPIYSIFRSQDYLTIEIQSNEPVKADH